jgi:hypothetical protein
VGAIFLLRRQRLGLDIAVDMARALGSAALTLLLEGGCHCEDGGLHSAGTRAYSHLSTTRGQRRIGVVGAFVGSEFIVFSGANFLLRREVLGMGIDRACSPVRVHPSGPNHRRLGIAAGE